jgi:hypothetical protein
MLGHGRKHDDMNMLSSAVLWTLWKTRNNLCFQGMCWTKLESLLGRCANLLRNWTMLSKPGELKKVEAWRRKVQVPDIVNVLDVISSVLPDLTPEWVCEAAAQLRTMPVNFEHGLVGGL